MSVYTEAMASLSDMQENCKTQPMNFWGWMALYAVRAIVYAILSLRREQ